MITAKVINCSAFTGNSQRAADYCNSCGTFVECLHNWPKEILNECFYITVHTCRRLLYQCRYCIMLKHPKPKLYESIELIYIHIHIHTYLYSEPNFVLYKDREC
ncbi:unnamed protein product [Ixodes pacificus]